jgi:hypothetical protein
VRDSRLRRKKCCNKKFRKRVFRGRPSKLNSRGLKFVPTACVKGLRRDPYGSVQQPYDRRERGRLSRLGFEWDVFSKGPSYRFHCCTNSVFLCGPCYSTSLGITKEIMSRGPQVVDMEC